VGSQVPVWIPIVVAMLGLAGVVLTQILAGRRERQRWREDEAREERRWQRERDARTYELRATAYAEVIGAIEAFDGVLYQARQTRESNEPIDDHQRSGLREAMSEAQHALGAVNLHAPEAIRIRIREATLPRMRLSTMLLDPASSTSKMRPAWDASQIAYRELRALMRRDLGFDAEPMDDLLG
jgi:hypothetical protein